jgi:CBS-domain-containing membrane protein
VTAGPDELVVVAARRMHDRDVKRLPVVDHGGALVGIVTRADLLKVFLRADDELRFDVLDHVVGDRLRLPLDSVEVVAVQSHLEWQVDDTIAQAPPVEPAPLM